MKWFSSPVLPNPRAGPNRQASLLLVAFLLAGCATFSGSERTGTTLEADIEAILTAPPLDQVNWGILIKDPDSGEILFDRNAQRKFVPASNMKILPTAAALILLGPEYRYRTEVWGVGERSAGGAFLDGDLVLRGTGDPTLSARFYPSAEAPLDSIAQRLWRAGIRTVTGSLVVDASAWDSTTVAVSWMTNNLPWTSSATGGAFAIGEGVLSIEVAGGNHPGAPTTARWWPSAAEDFLAVRYVTAHPDSSTRGRQVEYRPESRRLLVGGLIHPREVDTVRIAQRDPVRLASTALLAALRRRGIEVWGGLRIAWDAGERVGPGRCVTGPTSRPGEVLEGAPGVPASGPRLPHCYGGEHLSTLTSPPMADIVESILEPSQNWMAEQLVRTLGAELGEEGSWREGFRVEQELFVDVMGIDSLDFTYRDGSGMSAHNLVTPRGIARILEFMRASPHADLFRHALAEPGEEEGTLRNRIRELDGRVFAKTGTVSNVISLSGYLVGAEGRDLVFSILANGTGLPSGPVRRGVDAVVNAASRR